MSLIRVEPLDDELAASVIARAATLNVLAPETILGRKLGAQNCIDAVRDIGLGLEEYCSCFDFSPPAHQSLLLERTLVGYFLSDAQVAHGQARNRAALARQFPRRANHLRLCQLCYDEEQSNLGASVWNTAHQWPLTEVCLKHGVRLHTVSLKTGLRLPRPSDFEKKLPTNNAPINHLLTKFARAELRVVKLRRCGAFDEFMAALRAAIRPGSLPCTSTSPSCSPCCAPCLRLRSVFHSMNARPWPRS